MSYHSYSDDDDDLDGFDPMEVYTLEDFIAEQDVLDGIGERIGAKLKAKLEAGSAERPRRRSGPRTFIPRDHKAAHKDLMDNYFSEHPLYTDQMFRRRFRMRRPLFLRIVNALENWSPYFTYRTDATNRPGHSPLTKCTAAIRMLAYGTPADELDDTLKIAASTALECLDQFALGVIEVFGEEYLRPPNCEELDHMLQINESRGFPGMLGSIDCMHWQWEKCPTAWKGQFTRGDHGVPTMILEAVASKDLRIWHAYFGVAGSNNDINVLNQSTLFINELKGEAPLVHFTVNGSHYDTGYYLADGIYPEWAVFVKTVSMPQITKDKHFAEYQEGARKDVERAFGVLQSRFNVVRRPARFWKRVACAKVMEACIILHNMIVEDEKQMIDSPLDLNEAPGSCYVLPREVNNRRNIPFEEVLQRNSKIRARPTHKQLKKDLIQHIWEKFPPKKRM